MSYPEAIVLAAEYAADAYIISNAIVCGSALAAFIVVAGIVAYIINKEYKD